MIAWFNVDTFLFHCAIYCNAIPCPPPPLYQLTLIELELLQAIDAHELAVYIWEHNNPGMVEYEGGRRGKAGGGEGGDGGERRRGEGGRGGERGKRGGGKRGENEEVEEEEQDGVEEMRVSIFLTLSLYCSKQALSKKCRCCHCKIQQSKCPVVTCNYHQLPAWYNILYLLQV